MSNPLDPAELHYLHIDLDADELVLEITRKHWGRIIWPIVTLAVLFLLTMVISIYLFFIGRVESSTQAGWLFFGIFLWYVALIGYGISEWFAYRRSALLITTQRVIDIAQLNIIARRIQTIDIHEIQSCSGDLTSGMGIIFNYGDLWINTIGDKPISVHHIPFPEIVANNVMHHHNMIAHGRMPKPQSASSPHPAHRDAHQEEKVALAILPSDPPLPPAFHPPVSRAMTLLMFHVPSEQLPLIVDKLPAQKEPTIRYLGKTDYFEIEIIIPTKDVATIAETLKGYGAEDIVGESLDFVS